MLSRARPCLARSRAFAARLRGCDGGLAFVEFAVSLPVLLTLGLAGLETANLAMAHLRVSNIAMLTADNASRVRDGIDEAHVIELFTGAKMTGDSIEFRQNGRIILSGVEPNSHGHEGHGHTRARDGQWIRWQRCDGARNVTSAYGPESKGHHAADLPSVGSGANTIAAEEGTAVMLAEVTYQYQPLISEAIFGRPIIRYESAFNVRQRTNHALTNVSGLSGAQRRTCNHFNP